MKLIGLEMKKTTKGAPYKQFTLDNGKPLNVFDFDARYTELAVGVDILDTELVYDPKWLNYKLAPSAKAPGAFKRDPGAMTKAMDKKNENIHAAQDRKHDAIRMAGAQRDAVLMVTTFEKNEKNLSDVELRETIEKWMKYFLNLQDQPFI